MVNSLVYLLAAISAIAASTTASSLTVTIPSSNFLPNPQSLPPSTHATLTTLPTAQNAAKHILSAPLTSSGNFVFPDVVPGSSGGKESYLLDIRSREYVFAPYRVDVAADGRILGIWETFRGNQWDNRGAEKYTAPVGGGNQHGGNEVMVEAKVLSRRGFYEERPRCKCTELEVLARLYGVRTKWVHFLGQSPPLVSSRIP